MQYVNYTAIAAATLALAVSQAHAATGADFSDVRSGSLAAMQLPKPASATRHSAALARAQQRFAQAVQVAEQFAAQYRSGANGSVDPRRVELINNLMRGDAQGLAEASAASSLEAALTAAGSAVARRANTTAAANVVAANPAAVSSTTDELVYTPITPCRILDTRNISPSPPGSPFGALQTRVYDAVGGLSQGGNSCAGYVGAIPSAMAFNVTIDATGLGNPSHSGYLSIYPQGTGSGNSTSWMNYSGGQIIANEGIASINSANGEFAVYAQTPANVIIDSYGYFRAATPLAGAGQGLNWGTIARNVIGSATAQLRNDGTAPSGTGSLEITVGGNNGSTTTSGDKVAFGDQVSFAGIALSTITDVGYEVKTTQENIDAAGGGANMPAILIELWTKGTGVGYSTLNYSPNSNSAPNQWSGYIDAANDSTNAWGLTGSAFNSPATSANCGINGPRCTFAQVQALLTAANGYNPVILSVAVGKGRDYVWHGEIDTLRINSTIYDFEAQGVNSIAVP